MLSTRCLKYVTNKKLNKSKQGGKDGATLTSTRKSKEIMGKKEKEPCISVYVFLIWQLHFCFTRKFWFGKWSIHVCVTCLCSLPNYVWVSLFTQLKIVNSQILITSIQLPFFYLSHLTRFAYKIASSFLKLRAILREYEYSS